MKVKSEVAVQVLLHSQFPLKGNTHKGSHGNVFGNSEALVPCVHWDAKIQPTEVHHPHIFLTCLEEMAGMALNSFKFRSETQGLVKRIAIFNAQSFLVRFQLSKTLRPLNSI